MVHAVQPTAATTSSGLLLPGPAPGRALPAQRTTAAGVDAAAAQQATSASRLHRRGLGRSSFPLEPQQHPRRQPCVPNDAARKEGGGICGEEQSRNSGAGREGQGERDAHRVVRAPVEVLGPVAVCVLCEHKPLSPKVAAELHVVGRGLAVVAGSLCVRVGTQQRSATRAWARASTQRAAGSGRPARKACSPRRATAPAQPGMQGWQRRGRSSAQGGQAGARTHSVARRAGPGGRVAGGSRPGPGAGALRARAARAAWSRPRP